MKLQILMCIALAAFGRGKQNVVQTGVIVPPQTTFASTPSNLATGVEFTFTDATSAGTFSGGGNAIAKCRRSRSIWQAVRGAAGSGASGTAPLNYVFDESGIPLVGTQTECQYIAATVSPTGEVIPAKPSGSATIDILTAPYASDYSTAATIVGSRTAPAIVSNTQAKPSITGFSTSIAGDTWVCAALSSPTNGEQQQVRLPRRDAGSGGPTCDSGVVNYSDLTNASDSQEISPPALSGLPGSTRFSEVIVSESTQFTSSTATGLTISIGRTGTNNSELTGANVPLMVSSGDANFWPVGSPPPPVLTGTYDLVIAFKSTGANVNAFSAGKATWEICHYAGAER